MKKRRDRILWSLILIASIYFGTILTALSQKSLFGDWKFDKNAKSYEIGTVEWKRVKRQTENVFVNSANGANVTGMMIISTDNTSFMKSQGVYPYDVFNLESRKNGAVILHVVGMLYMFVALAIVCDEFFVPALEVIIRSLSISDDVAGATFMAAGGSAPELFISIIGVFLAKSNVGVGTIVGSAVFNILFVIGMCSLFSRKLLQLTWWPLFRDCFFYIISLFVLIIAFSDSSIQIYESIALITIYVCYVSFMKFNQTIERYVKSKLASWRSSSAQPDKVETSENLTEVSRSVRVIVESISEPQKCQHHKSNFSYGIVQLMMHSLDPATDASTAEKSSQMYALARMKTKSPRAAKALSVQYPERLSQSRHRHQQQPTIQTTVALENEDAKVTSQIPSEQPLTQLSSISSKPETSLLVEQGLQSNQEQVDEIRSSPASQSISQENSKDEKINKKSSVSSLESHDDALDMSWPKTNSKRCIYLLIAPITLLLWVTLPDVRVPGKEKWYMASFFGSILWIAIFSYLMVWLAHQIGETAGVSEAVMGLTFLAAGTSVPDLITSVIVARKGLGDMAVSSSVGSNIFDVTIGLPFPWFLASIFNLGKPIGVESQGLFCSVLLLFAMLLFVIISIAVCGWKMTKTLGIVMLLLYVVFLILSLLLEFSIIKCLVLTT